MRRFDKSHSPEICRRLSTSSIQCDCHADRSAQADLESLTCRKRHKKCDETRPACGPCSKSSRECLYASVGTSSTTSSIDRTQPARREATPGEIHDAVFPSEQGATETNNSSPGPTGAATSLSGVPGIAVHASPVHSHVRLQEPANDPITSGVQEVGGQASFDDANHTQTVYNTPDTILSEYLTTDLASTRWLDLLATDAAQADKAFSLPPTRYPSPALGDIHFEHNASQTDLHNLNTAVSQAQIQTGLGGSELPRLNQAVQHNDVAACERHAWQLDQNICLQDHEVELFRMFTDRAALWLDVFDPLRHFSTHATRLAVRLHAYELLSLDNI